jgi:hypothetical protein
MFRPPDLSSHPRRTIHDLPDELWILIGAKFTHLRRNRDLANLSLVSKKWRAIAQEWLLKRPRFNLTHIDKYLWELGHHEHLHPQIHSLEIWSSSENRIPCDANGAPTREYKLTPAPQWNPEFFTECKDIIRYWAKDKKYRVCWFTALHQDCVPALFCVLVCILPNLEELKLGNAWLRDFPVFGNMLSPNVNAARTLAAPYGFDYMNCALDLLLPRLVVLEVPADMSSVHDSMYATTLFNFHKFNSLKEVGITMMALWLRPSARRITPPDPREIFPPSLEVLKISEATWATLAFLQNLCLAKIGGHYPALRRVEVYYMDPLIQTEMKYATFVPEDETWWIARRSCVATQPLRCICTFQQIDYGHGRSKAPLGGCERNAMSSTWR